MSTSLAAQLKKLAVPQTSVLERDKKRPSLLFDPKEAANIDRDTFYDIGISGLHDLKALDGDFAYFENNLFSPTSKRIERSVKDKETNQNLNKVIKKFFMTLSPYFLLKPAHKALEWLIQRFSIHEYNKDDFLMLILPYHETNIFVKCLLLFNFKNKNDTWNWLRPLRRSGVHLPKTTLFNHCVTDRGFLTLIGNVVIQAVKERGTKANKLTTLFSFYCTTTIGSLENTSEITEPHLTAILPALMNGLLSDVPDYTASTYMITAQLIKKTRLSHKLLNSLVQKISHNSQKHLRMEATLLVLLIYQAQKEHFSTVSDEALNNLTNANWFLTNLSKLASGGSYVTPLLVPILSSALKKNKHDKYRRFIEKLVSEIHFNDITADILIRIVLECCPAPAEDNEESSSEEDDSEPTSDISAVEWYATFIKQLETQYPNAFDKIVRQVLSSKVHTFQKQAQALQHILSVTMSTDNESSCTIFEKLYHPNPNFRLAATKFLVKNFKNLSVKDKEMLQGAISERMTDDDSNVIRAVLKLKNKDLIYLLGENNFVEVSIKLLAKCIQNKKYLKIMNDLVKHICYGDILKHSKLFLPVLAFLFPVTENELQISLTILSSDFSEQYSFLKDILNKIKTIKHPAQFCKVIYNCLINKKKKFNYSNIDNSFKHSLSIYKYLDTILIVSNLLEDCSAEAGIKALENISSRLGQCKTVDIKDFNISQCILCARNDSLPLQGFLECLKILINKINYFQMQNIWLPLSSSNHSVKFLINTLIILVRGCHLTDKIIVKLYSLLLKQFLNKFFPQFVQKINFLANIIVYDDVNIIDLKTQLRIIKVLTSLVTQSTESASWVVESNSKIIMPALLIGLIHPVQELRTAIFEIINHIANLKINNSFISLLKKLLTHKHEILLDSEQLPLILCTIFEDNQISNEIKDSLSILCKMASDIHIPYHINSKLLQILTFVNSGEIFEKTSVIATHVLKSSIIKNTILEVNKSYIVYNVILRFNDNIAKTITFNSSSWKFIKLALEQDTISLVYHDNKYSCPSVLILEQINRELFNNLNSEIQSDLIKVLANIATVSENPDVVSCTYKIMKKIDLDAKLIIDELTIMKDIKSRKNKLPQRKFRRASEIPTIDILDMIEWKRGTTILEFIQDKKKLINGNLLLPILFDILKKCLDFDEQGAVEYPKQIILSSILHICNKMDAEGVQIPTTVFNMELVVQCIRASHNPQTHHHALLVLAHTATLIPEQVLHNIMAIFTFMGSSVLRHDDAYSFQIISKIIDTVIPILVKGNNDETEASVASVLRVFVDVMLDIPEHRRMALLKKLLSTLGIEEYMWLFLVLVFEVHVIHGNDSKGKQNKSRLLASAEPVAKRLDIAANIVFEFPSDTILSTTIKLLEYLKSLPNEINEKMDVYNSFTFDMNQHTSKQFRHYKYTLVTFLSGLLCAKQLVNKIAVLNNDELLSLEPSYKNLIINILTYIQSVSKIVDRTVNTPQAQYWKVMLHHCYDIMDSINALLTTEMFLLVIRGLIVHNIPTVRRKAIEILNTKLQHQPSFFYSSPDDTEVSNSEGLFALIPSLLNIIKSVEGNDIEPEYELTQQTALLSLKLLIKLLASNNPDKFTPILSYITDLVKSNKISGNILASVVLCLAELCSKLRAHAIPGLVRYMPAVIKVLKNQKHQETPGLLLMCIITAIQKIVESLPLFLSPYLEKLLCELTILSAKWSHDKDNSKLTPFVKKLDSIRSNIGSIIPARILIPIICETYNTLLKNNEFAAIGPLLNVLAENLSQLRGNELTNYLSDLSSFFVNALEFRNNYSTKVSSEIITATEDHLIKTVVVLVLKLSESTFRPFYYRLFAWAVRSDLKSERVITFYRLSHGFSESLKGLFVLFAGHFVTNAASLLDSCNEVKSDSLYFSDENKNILLIESILNTLKSVFSYDNYNFVDKDRFETLMQSIVDQLENTISSKELLTERAKNLLIPCIAQFAAATADDALWKQLNYQILLKMRHNLPEIRLVALNCLCEVVRKLGEDFLPLLPETIPFLAELLEDEDEGVEKRCQNVVQDLERFLGEPLQKYF